MQKRTSFYHLIDKITNDPTADTLALTVLISKSKDLVQIVSDELRFIANASDLRHKERHLSLLLDIILARSGPWDRFSANELKTLIRALIEYPVELSSIEMYTKLTKALKSSLSMWLAITNLPDEEILKFVVDPIGLNTNLALGVLIGLSPSILKLAYNFIFSHFDPSSVSSVLSLQYLFAFKLEGETAQQFGYPDNLHETFSSLLLSDNRLINYATIITLQQLFKTIENAQVLYASLVDGLTRQLDLYTVEVSAAVAELPVEGPVQISVQFSSIIPALSEHFDDFGSPLAKNLCRFMNDRKNDKGLEAFITKLDENPQTELAALSITLETEIYKELPCLIGHLFKEIVSSAQIRAAAMMCKQKELTNDLYKVMAKTFFLGVETHKDAVLEALPSFLPLYTKFPALFCEVALIHIGKLDEELITAFAKLIATLDLKEAHQNPPIGEGFATLFVQIWSKNSTREEKWRILQLFKTDEVQCPTSNAAFVDAFVQNGIVDTVRKIAMKQREFVLVASLPNTSDKDIDVAIDQLIEAESDQIPEFFKSIGSRSIDRAMDKLVGLAKSKKVSSMAILKKKKNTQQNLRKSILSTAASLSSLDLAPKHQIMTYLVIELVLPKPDGIQEYAGEAAALVKVLPKLKDATPSKKLVDSLICIPLFAECLPQMLASTAGNLPMVEQILKTWSAHLAEVPAAKSKNLDIVQLCLRLEPKCFASIFTIMGTHQSENHLPYVNFCLIAIEQNKSQVTCPTVVSILRVLCPYLLSQNSDCRMDATSAICVLFGLAPEAKCGLTPAQITVEYIDIFSRGFKTATPDLVDAVLDMIGNSSMPLWCTLLLRSIVTACPTNVKHLSAILDNSVKAKGPPAFHIEKAMMDLAKMNMTGFLPLVIVNLHTPFRKSLVNKILRSPELRQIFLTSFHLLVLSTPSTKAMTFFQLLPLIIETETATELSVSAFSTIAADLLVYIAFAYETKPKQKVNEEISQCFDQILLRSAISKKVNLNVNVSDFHHLVDTIGEIVKVLREVEIQKVEGISANAYSMLESKSESVCLTAGIFFVEMASKFATETSNAFTKKVYGAVVKAFTISNERNLSLICENEQISLKEFTKDELDTMFGILIDSLAGEKNEEREATTQFLVRLITLVQKTTLEEKADKLLSVVRQTYVRGKGSPELLEDYVDVRLNLNEFAGDAMPSIANLCAVMQGRLIKRLGGLEATVNRIVDASDRRGITIVGHQLIDTEGEWLELVGSLYQKAKKMTGADAEMEEFGEALLLRSINEVAKKGKETTKATEIIESVLC